jgi:hypothetical protein
VITLPAPAVPTFSNVGPFTLEVSWSLVTGAATHRLERAPDSGGTWGAWTELSANAISPYVNPDSRRTRATGTGCGRRTRAERRVLGRRERDDAAGYAGKPELSLVTKTSITVSWTAPAVARRPTSCNVRPRRTERGRPSRPRRPR